MKQIYFLITMGGLLSLTSCTQPSLTLEEDNTYHIKSEGFKEFKSTRTWFPDHENVPEEFSEQGEQKNLHSTTEIERIPNFQSNEFKSVMTSDREKIKKNLVVDGGNVKVNVESIPLNEFVDFIFSSVLKMNYTVDKNVKTMKQPITLNMAKSQPKKEVLAVVENILKNESVTFSQKEGTVFVVKSSKRSLTQGLSDRFMVMGRDLPSGLKDDQKVLVFAPFYYTKPKEIANIARRLKVNKVKINFLNENIAILSGEAFDVKQLLELVKIVDSPAMEQKTPYVLKLEYINVKKFAEQMKTILESNSIPIAQNIRDVGMVLTPIEEINTLLVLSSKKSWVQMLTFWKNKLDVLSEVDNEHAQLYIYKVKHRKADELAEVLQDVLSVSMLKSDKKNSSLGVENNQTQNAKRTTQVNIKSDLHSNSIMMNITPAQYKKIVPIIKKLDTLPLQVSVEVILAEVTMTDSFSLGFEWSILNNKEAISKTSTKLSGAYGLGLGGKGVTSSLFTTNLTSIINAYAKKSKLEILSRPRLVILNNQTGNINVGQQVPVINSESSATDLGSSGGKPNILRNISYVNTGMTLNLTPTINSNGILTMQIGITLSEAETNDKLSSIDSPIIVNRSLTTSTVMQSGNSLLLGGIISQNNSNGHGGVPLLQDLPWIGDAFKSKSKSNVKTELIILIKPKILNNIKEFHQETEEFKLLLKNLQQNIFF